MYVPISLKPYLFAHDTLYITHSIAENVLIIKYTRCGTVIDPWGLPTPGVIRAWGLPTPGLPTPGVIRVDPWGDLRVGYRPLG